ncbi:ribosome biogenesis GTPase Der [Candidatus Peribacteria bacterium]|nr:ribosome biogenesis GTPase Der [Candidatus Peribacteria bacterium]
MSRLPTVAIIGRPNTGKSTLFNRLVGSRRAIESEVAGTTRDLISHRIDEAEVPYILLDTGGIGSTEDKDFEADVKGQSILALEHADLIVFTVNSREAITGDDQKVVDMLRKRRKKNVPVLVVLTKVDDPGKSASVIADFQEMNVGEDLVTVSAPHYLGILELNSAIAKQLKKLGFLAVTVAVDPETKAAARIAIIGRPNVGKSSIVNAMMSDGQRETLPLLVSPVAGTTRDSTDTEVKFSGRSYILVDTAGLKKRVYKLEDVERFSTMRTIQAIEQSDVVVLVLDALVEVSQQDKRIASMAIESGKGLIILANKIDGIKGEARKQSLHEISLHLSFCKFAPILPCSAVSREGLLKLFDMVDSVQRSRVRHITTRELRRWFEQIVHGQPLGEVGKCKHITQADDLPPTFVLFVKDAKRVRVSQLRYLENRLRETFGFDGVPIRWVTKSTPKKESKMKVK